MAKITKQLTPLYHNVNVRTEFRIDSDNLKFSDMRLLDIYFTGNDGNILPTTSNGGITEYIKSITLLSGNIQIDRCDSVDLLGCHRENNVSNLYNRCIQKILKQNNYAFRVTAIDTFGNSQIRLVAPRDFTNYYGYLQLSDYLLFLKSTPVFNMPNLRLVIEWSNLAKTSTTSREPMLVYEEAYGEGQPPFLGTVYNSWELDRFLIPAVANGNEQNVKYRYQGFNNKRVNRFLMATTPATVNTTTNAKLCSVPQRNEEYQIYWNNMPIYPQAIDENLKSRLLLDSWGNKTQPFGQDLYNINYYDEVIDPTYEQPTQSWAGIDLQSLPITNLQLGYKRTGWIDAGLPTVGIDSLNMYLFGEVVKQVTFNAKGQPVVAYL
jgi:hypothetical protein